MELHYEEVLPDQSSSFRCFHRVCRDLASDHPWHFHPQYEMSWVMRSSGLRYVGDYTKPYHADEVVLYGPNLPHCSRNDLSSPDGGIVEYITVQFDPSCIGSDFLTIPEAAPIRALLGEARRALMFAPDAACVLGPHLRRLVELTGMSRLLKLVEILDLMTRLQRSSLTSAKYLDTVVPDDRLIERLNKVQRYIDAHFRGMVSQGEIAERLEMSPSAFSKFMRASTGRTFMSMVRLARINEACRLLVHTDERITDIALECGYQHTSHFDENFFRMKNMSPTDYRRQARQAKEREQSLPPLG